MENVTPVMGFAGSCFLQEVRLMRAPRASRARGLIKGFIGVSRLNVEDVVNSIAEVIW